MKTKLLLLSLLLVAVITKSNAQSYYPTYVETKYQSELQAGFGVGVGMVAIDRVSIHTIQGVMIGRHFSTGVGFGFNIIPAYVSGYSPEVYLPIFLNLKGYLPITMRSSLFLSLDVGGSFGVTDGFNGMKGLLVTPAFGVSITNRVNLSLGYEVQKISESGFSVNMNAVSIKFGCRF